MSTGPKDYIDQLLVKKYAKEKVDNNEVVSLVNASDMLNVMEDFASMHRNMIALNQKLKLACKSINSKSVNYRTSQSAC